MHKIEIRKQQSSDIDSLRKIFYDIRNDEFEWVEKNSISLVDYDKSTLDEYVLVATVSEKVVGFISIWEPDNFIHNLFVSKEFRKHGIGDKLITEAINIFAKPMTLKCVKNNYNAVKFYLSHGWVIKSEEFGAEGPYYVMVIEK